MDSYSSLFSSHKIIYLILIDLLWLILINNNITCLGNMYTNSKRLYVRTYKKSNAHIEQILTEKLPSIYIKL